MFKSTCLKNASIWIFLAILYLFFPLIITKLFSAYKDTGQIGDTFGGILTPIFTIFSCYLLYKTLDRQDIDNKKNFSIIKNQSIFIALYEESKNIYNSGKNLHDEFLNNDFFNYFGQSRTYSIVREIYLARAGRDSTFRPFNDIVIYACDSHIRTLIVDTQRAIILLDLILDNHNEISTNLLCIDYISRWYFLNIHFFYGRHIISLPEGALPYNPGAIQDYWSESEYIKVLSEYSNQIRNKLLVISEILTKSDINENTLVFGQKTKKNLNEVLSEKSIKIDFL